LKGSTTYAYDNNGNTLTAVDGGNITLFGYSAKNELVSTTKAGTTTSFLYNASGIRTGKTQNSATTNFVVDENRDYAQVLLETGDSTSTRYTYGDDLLSQTRNGETNYFHYDGLGSTRALSDGVDGE
jgi:YD repeat-containing protein